MVGKEEGEQDTRCADIYSAEEKLPRLLFWSSLLLLLFISSLILFQSIEDKKEYASWNEKAMLENSPSLCENIKSLRLSSQCYSQFIAKGFDCTNQSTTSDACLLAQGVAGEDDLFCDAVFPEKVRENLECRVSVFIQRYTHEGLSDCCHIE